MQFLKENKIQILLIFAITLLTWYKILFRFPTGEGYFYFYPANTLNLKSLTPSSIIGSYGFFAKLYFTIFIPIFKQNISYYMYLQFIIMFSTYLTFYWALVKIFKDKVMSTLSTIFLIANYVGSFTMMGQGDYQRFIQRVPNLIPTLISFTLLVLFLRTSKNKYLVWSICIYAFSMFLAHYTAFFLPIFVFLPLMKWLIEKKISFKKVLLIPLVFGVITIILSRTDSLSRPNYSILDFITHTQRLTEMVTYQSSITGFPVQFTQFLAGHAKESIVRPYTTFLPSVLFIVTLFLYLGYLKIRKNKEDLSLYITFILSVLVVSFLILYAYDTVPNPLTNFGEDRIYFVHSIFFAVIWGIIVKAFFGLKNKRFYIKASLIITSIYLFQNIASIWNDMDSIKIHSDIAINYMAEIKSVSPEFTKNSVIVEDSELITFSSLLERFYSIKNSNFVSFDGNWQTRTEEKMSNKNDVFIFTIKPNTSQIINLTKDFRSQKDVKPL